MIPKADATPHKLSWHFGVIHSDLRAPVTTTGLHHNNPVSGILPKIAVS